MQFRRFLQSRDLVVLVWSYTSTTDSRNGPHLSFHFFFFLALKMPNVYTLFIHSDIKKDPKHRSFMESLSVLRPRLQHQRKFLICFNWTPDSAAQYCNTEFYIEKLLRRIKIFDDGLYSFWGKCPETIVCSTILEPMYMYIRMHM